MIPILFDGTATNFTTNGIGRLSEASQCKVTEERNGAYTLSMRYPITGKYFSEIQNERIIVAVPFASGTRQAFMIKTIEPSSSGTVTITAEHISYRANYIPVLPFSATGIAAAVAGLNQSIHLAETSPFTISTDVTNTTSVFQVTKPKSLRSCLGGDEGSLLDVFASKGHCEYEWDNFNIRLHYNRGNDKGYSIRYAKNLVSADRELTTEDLVTGVLPLWSDFETDETIYGSVQYADNVSDFPYRKTIVVDFTEEFDEQPTLSQLNALAKSYANDYAYIKDSIEIEFFDLNDHSVKLCDTVTVVYDKIGISLKLKVIKTVWDVLTERYESITVGENKSSLANTLYDNMQTIIHGANTRMTSIVRKIDYENGIVSQAITDVNERVSDEEDARLDADIKSVKTQYYLSSSDESQTGGSWVDTIPSVTDGKYLWSRMALTHNDDSVTYTTPVLGEDATYQEIISNRSNITQTATDLTSEISRSMQQDTQITTNYSSLQQTVNGLTVTVGTKVTQSQVDSSINSYKQSVENYMRYDSSGTLELGNNSSQFKARLSNTRLAFTGANGQEVAWISNNQLYIKEAVVQDSFSIAPFTERIATISGVKHLQIVYVG